MKKYLRYFLLILSGILFGVGINSFVADIKGPPKKDTQFVKACGELNGKSLTYDNLKVLQGKVYASCNGSQCVSVQQLQPSHIVAYENFLLQCGKEREVIEKLPINANYIPVEYKDFNYSPISCLEKYYNQLQTGQLQIGDDGTFKLSSARLDNAWTCSIKTVNGKIQAGAQYFYD